MDYPRVRRKKRFAYTEDQMAVAFERVLKSRQGLAGLGPFWRVFREVDCHRGRPDFVAIEGKQKFRVEANSLGFVAATVLALLRPSAHRSLNYLVTKSGFSRPSVRLAIRDLKRLGHIRQSDKGESYTLDPRRNLFDVEVWAFELKLDKPKRAIFQAQQYRLFAQKVLIVVPPTQVASYTKHHGTMERWGIGLASFDPDTKQFSVEIAARWGEPVSKQQQIFALGRLLDRKAARLNSESRVLRIANRPTVRTGRFVEAGKPMAAARTKRTSSQR